MNDITTLIKIKNLLEASRFSALEEEDQISDILRKAAHRVWREAGNEDMRTADLGAHVYHCLTEVGHF